MLESEKRVPIPKTGLMEYRVRPVTRYVVTRFQQYDTHDPKSLCGVETVGEFANERQAQEAAHVFGEFDKRLEGWTVVRPERPEPVSIEPTAG